MGLKDVPGGCPEECQAVAEAECKKLEGAPSPQTPTKAVKCNGRCFARVEPSHPEYAAQRKSCEEEPSITTPDRCPKKTCDWKPSDLKASPEEQAACAEVSNNRQA